jgi:hypothetical protein
MTKKAVTLIAMVCVSAASGAWAEDLTSAEKILCTSVEATVCYADGDCEFGPPWNWGVPQFIEIDFQTKQLSTTKASHERRASPFKNEQRSEGLIFLQGVENGRAFSIVIEEATGRLSAAIASDVMTLSVFGACTPAPFTK